MQVKINYLSVVSLSTGKKSEVLELRENISIASLVQDLCHKYGNRFKDIVCSNAKNRKYLVDFWINQVPVGDSYILKDGDEVTLLLALGGG